MSKKRVAVVIAHNFEDSEVIEPVAAIAGKVVNDHFKPI